MPLFNTQQFVSQSIQSILMQDFKDFELIIVDDASTDGSAEIASSFDDTRITILKNNQNLGVAACRNIGLSRSVGAYIAPFDSDDVALPGKLTRQVRFLESYPGFGLVGSWVRMIDNEGRLLKKKWKLQAKANSIPSILLFRNYFCHSSVIYRRKAIPNEGYSNNLNIGEDYKMWIEIARKWKVWNLQEYLLHYRVHSDSITRKDHISVSLYDHKIYKENFELLGIALTRQQLNLLTFMKDQDAIENKETLIEIESFLLHIIKKNAERNLFDQKELVKVVFNRWLKVLHKTRGSNLAMPALFLKSPLLRTYLSVIA